ncbi:MAG: histidinol dehydrogenase, partial [Thermoprotei archaeon]
MELLNLKELSLGDLEKIRLRGIRGMEEAIERVKPIIADVRARGDEALRLYEEKFSGVQSSYEIKVSEEEVEEAYGLVDKGFLEALRSSIAIVKRYHESCTPKPWVVEVAEGVRAGVIPRPVDRAGLYIPGGRAPYPSTVVMLAIPALTAGVKRVIACTPPSRGGRVNPYILVALSECGVKEVYRAGGAQAIAAMAYGTQTVPRVDVIAGPGNVYVTAAKLLVSSVVGIDVLAGPSELLVVADESAEPSLVAIDLASQAEHDPLSQIALATTSRE